ncbi:BTBD8 [Mytilus edulis]|uniref:BTBD8 n=1 Tax=Mytilus edulis TaxID=6550 RepID=A0A8S3VP35_MYTED|nr:BTBD8 [Mytilus edulis]
MARPKEKIPSSKTKTFLERCQHEKDNLKQSVIKQLQKDLGSLLHNEEHSDLMIRAEGKEVKVHKFILKSRCPAVFDRFLELSTGEDSDVLVMPSWVTYKTVLFIVRKLYFVETEPLDETVDKQDEILMDYLKSLLFQHQNVASNGCEKSNNQHQITIEAENGENDISNNQCENHADIADSNLCQKETTSLIKKEGEPSHGGASEEDLTINSLNNVNNLEEIHNDSQIGNVCMNSEEINYLQSSFSDMVMLSYGSTLPYETCNRVGEDLLRGYQQEIQTDCQITVSGDHFKVHKVSPSVVKQILMYLYGGVVDLINSCAVKELIMTADMYCLEGIKAVVVSYLKTDYCHMFHEMCAYCEELLPEALTIAVAYRMDQLRDDCVNWINRNKLKMWRSYSLNEQPEEVLNVCYQTAVEKMNEETVLDILLNFKNMNQNDHRLRLNDSAIEFIRRNFVHVLRSSAFYDMNRGHGYKIILLKDMFEDVIKSLPINKACEAYHSLLLNCIKIKEDERRGCGVRFRYKQESYGFDTIREVQMWVNREKHDEFTSPRAQAGATEKSIQTSTEKEEENSASPFGVRSRLPAMSVNLDSDMNRSLIDLTPSGEVQMRVNREKHDEFTSPRAQAGATENSIQTSTESIDFISKIRKQLRLTEGTGSCKTFWFQFELISTANKWDNGMKAYELATSLRQLAQGIVTDIEPAKRLNYDYLVSALTSRF